METIVLGIIVILIAGVLIFGGGKLRVLLKGFVGLFVEDLAKTPEGASAVYNQAIEKSQNDYNTAHTTLQKVAGQLDSSQKSVIATNDKLQKTEEKCEAFAKSGQFDKVELFSQQRNDLLEELEFHTRTVKELEPIFEEAKRISNYLEQKLTKLKKDKTRVTNDLRLNKQLKDMYDDMDELKNTTNVDKLLDSVKEGVKDSREKAVGAKVVHGNKLSTKISNADEDAKKLVSNDYVEELKKKYQK